MRKRVQLLAVMIIGMSVTGQAAGDPKVGASNGISYPQGWQDWASIAVSHRTDNRTLRVVLGNDLAVKAARRGETNPWPDGSIIGKIVWRDAELKDWKAATVPGPFVHVEFMFKDATKYAKSYGWGWARWVGMDKKPFENGMGVCIGCHRPVKGRDWVFSDPAQVPE